MDNALTIGAVAERTGVAPSALRYYEAEGLITSSRTDGNQRRYHREVLRRVSFVKVAQRVGLTLEEIRVHGVSGDTELQLQVRLSTLFATAETPRGDV